MSNNLTVNTRTQDILLGGFFGLVLGIIGNIWVAVFDHKFIEPLPIESYDSLLIILGFGIVFYIFLIFYYVERLDPKTKYNLDKRSLLQRFISSEYFVIFIISIFLALVFTLYLLLSGLDLSSIRKDNFSSELFGIFITSIIIPLFIILREQLQWRSVKDAVYKKIGIELNGIFIELSSLFIEDAAIGGVSSDTPLNEIWRTRFFNKLEEFKDKDKITLNEIGRGVIL
jgi:hypothetical protein